MGWRHRFVSAIAGVALTGAVAFVWTAAPHGAGLTPPTAKIVFVRSDGPGDSERVYVVNADGSGRHRTQLPGTPYFSPDGRKFAYFVADPTRLYVADASGRRRQILRERGYNGCLDPQWSPNGKKLLYQLDCDVDFQAIGVVNADGTDRKILTGRWSMNPAWSPDGRTIAFTSVKRPGVGWGLYLMDEHGRGRKRIPGRYRTPEPTPYSRPAWSPNGKRIFYMGGEQLFSINRDGTGARKVAPSLRKIRDFDLSLNGRKVVLTAPGKPDRGWEIFVVNADGSNLRQLTHNRTYDTEPKWSPDGRKIVFTHVGELDPNPEIYVMNADGSAKTNVSRHKGFETSSSWIPAAARL